MAFTLAFGGSVNNTSGFTSYPNNYVYTDGFAFPAGNPDINGNRVVEVYSVSAGYASGASGISPRILRNGLESAGGGARYAGGGNFRFLIRYTSGTLHFGRNTASGAVTRDAADGGSWDGPLVGSFTWATNPTTPQAISASRSGRDVKVTITGSASNGGSTISAYYVQASSDGGASWGSARNISSGTYTFEDLEPGKTWIFRTFARNGVGDSPVRVSGGVFVPAGGKRHNGSSFVYTAIARRHNGSGWADLTVAKRHNGSTWVDLN